MSTVPISRAHFTPPRRLQAWRHEKIVEFVPFKTELTAVFLRDLDKGGGLDVTSTVAFIRLSPALNEADAMALAYRAVAEPSLIDTDPGIQKWEGTVYFD